MRVLIFTQYYWPETFPITAEVARLRQRGIHVTVVTGKPNYPAGRIFPEYRRWRVQREIHEGIEIIRLPILPRGQNSSIRLIANYLSFVFSGLVIAPFVLRGRKFDTIFVYAPSPILQAIPAIAIARLKKAKLVVWVQDLWPESLSATGFIKNRLVLASVRRVARLIYRFSNRILVPSRAFVAPVAELTDDPGKIYYVPNPIPNIGTSTGGTAEVTQLAERIGQHFSFVFAGNLGHAQALDVLVEAVDRLRDVPDLRVFLIGSGQMDEWLHNEIARRGLTQIELPGRFPPEAMSTLLSRASALLVSLKAEKIFSYTVPSKLQTYLAMSRPIVAALDGEGAIILEESKAGISCRAGDPEALASAMRKMVMASQDERRQMGLSGREYFEVHFAPGRITDALVEHMGCRNTATIDQCI